MQDPRFLAFIVFFALFFAFFISVFYLAIRIKPKKSSLDKGSWTVPHYLLEELLRQKEKPLAGTK
jgi:hypothetical protein